MLVRTSFTAFNFSFSIMLKPEVCKSPIYELLLMPSPDIYATWVWDCFNVTVYALLGLS